MKFYFDSTKEVVTASFEDTLNKTFNTAIVPVQDGQIHRFAKGGKSERNCWYIYYDSGVGIAGDWSSDLEVRFLPQNGSVLSDEERAAIQAKAQEIERQREEYQREMAVYCDAFYSNLPVAQSHPYAEKKRIQLDANARMDGEGHLVLPVYDCATGNLISLQYIDADGHKKFHSGARTKGGCLCIGSDVPTFLCEGYATGRSIYEATGKTVIVAFNAGNLLNVAPYFPNCTVVADNDESGTGQTKAQATGLPVILIPQVGMDANDYVNAGYDLAALLKNDTFDDFVSDDDWLEAPKPISWLVKNWIEQDSLFMVYGTPGCGKSFVALSILLTVSTGLGSWFGNKTKSGSVAYLCGEGLNGIRSRVALWYQQNNLHPNHKFFCFKHSVDLDNVSDLQHVISRLDTMPEPPVLVIIDTLNRFNSGDENSATDARAFIAACDAIRNRFHCAVGIIHHTGVDQAAQNRARGSSAFKGAMDTEIMLTNENGLITITQTKQKNIELLAPMALKLKPVDVAGWYDEDGEPISSAILKTPEASDVIESQAFEIRTITLAWSASAKHETLDGYPLVRKKDIKNQLSALGWGHDQRENVFKKGRDNFCARLVESEILKEIEENNAWQVIDPVTVSIMNLMRKSPKPAEEGEV